jgi:phosphate transport system substrate-binding protein
MKRSGYFTLIVVVCAVVGLVAKTLLPAAAQDSDPLAVIAADYPRVDGSTSTLPLQRVIASVIYDVPWLWSASDVTNEVFTGFTLDQTSDPRIVAATARINAFIHSGTHESYVSLIEHRSDLILVARAPSKDELTLAMSSSVELDVQPVALDAFVFLANKANPIVSLTLDELRSIYTGSITDWSALGVQGPLGDQVSTTINPYTRNPNSGSQELMEQFVMQGETMINAPDMEYFTMVGPLNAVNDDPSGIGYSVYYYASFIQYAPNIKMVQVEGVTPTSATIADQSYPLTAEVYVVVRTDEISDSTAVLLRDWLLTPEGQAAVAASGYVPIESVSE